MAVSTVSGFSGPPTASQTFGTLRLSDNGRLQRRWRIEAPSPVPQDEQRPLGSDTNPLKPVERCIARVTGFDEYATKAIRTANEAGEDVLSLSWAGCESVMSLMRRIEDLVCIPLMYWRLACGVEVLDPAALTITHPQFLKGPIVDLVLVPLSALDLLVDSQQPMGTSLASGSDKTVGSVEEARSESVQQTRRLSSLRRSFS
ncbi:hypothetical protein FOMPIDRAFT_1044973 [Fomitopsis schrenkii]|uniref:Uncharacterized protein n=1 Tax=Fomitopsis schrenkii TaxID=2126942 RepID=S8FX16_FOMSC|nr:hypothetical protein FOMPIDRAFT_1044973 [Fomitopsis schrenkii]